ncbi:hypothetical protein [Streptomyces sp. NPDC001389]|uniref:hypothetical protein n=1 Tax=Streptomyces sp. NPDC001389 TaxID=3364569 RepID=UPI003687D83E
MVESSAERLERENSQLVRKIRGAKDALTHSEDGISQAANLLIEVIDRIMREAFTKEDVMAWVEANLPDEPGLTFEKDDTVLPNKRAEALCFVYRRGPTAREANEYDSGQGPSLIHDVLAVLPRVIVATRAPVAGPGRGGCRPAGPRPAWTSHRSVTVTRARCLRPRYGAGWGY